MPSEIPQTQFTQAYTTPTMRPAGSPLPINWEQVRQMDPFTAATYLQQIAQTQGQPVTQPFSAQGLLRPEYAAEMTVPASQKLLNNLMGTYAGLQDRVLKSHEAALDAPALRKAAMMDEEYIKGLMADEKRMRDVTYREAVAKIAASEVNTEYLRFKMANPDPGTNMAELQKLYIDNLAKRIDDALNVIKAGKDTDLTWKHYMSAVLEHMLWLSASLREKKAEELLQDTSFKGNLRNVGWKGEKPLLSVEEIEALKTKVKTDMASTGTGTNIVGTLEELFYLGQREAGQ